ncbi:MAG: hypothetical protein H8E55_08945 [Pelagibacterales bacterium]|nr:hypothetical protein [Pelagibacterales bacterium]
MEKQKYVVYVKGSPLFERGMFHVYRKNASIKPTMEFMYKLNEGDFKRFIVDNKDNDIEVYEEVSLEKTPPPIMNRNAKILMNADNMYNSLYNVREVLLEGLYKDSEIKNQPFFINLNKMLNNIDRIEGDDE